jgi:CheY-like chemotaxis protein
MNINSPKSMYENLKIGVVEDDQLTAEMIKNTLTSYGYDSTPSVSTYLKAVKMIKKESPDLLLIDICLDGKRDGVDLGQTINKKYQVPFIFITSHTNKEVVERAKNVYPQAYLTKPFTAEELKCALEICLNNRVAHIDSFESSKNAIFLKDGHYFISLNSKILCTSKVTIVTLGFKPVKKKLLLT